jgi:DNA polymerase III delta prime subunit
MSFDGKIKIVILDECDGLSEQSQDALRNVMEEYAENVRFILTCNYPYKVKDPVKSRCQTIDLIYEKKEYFQKLIHIVDAENVEVSSLDELKKLKKLFEGAFPNIRKAIGILQKSVIGGKLVVFSAGDASFADTVYKKIQTESFYEIREYVNKSEPLFSGDYAFLFKSLLEVVYSDKEISDNKKVVIILLISDHLYKHAFVQDKEVNFFACVLRVRESYLTCDPF